MFGKNHKFNNYETIIAKDVRIKGDLKTGGSIAIEGEIEGFIKTTQKIYIGESAIIHGNVSAKEAVIKGKIFGNIKTDQSELATTANIVGNIKTKILGLEAGASFNGKFKVGTSQEPIEDTFIDRGSKQM